ncbi:MAG: SirB2 family protein [Gemmatimonadota bacterium]
MYATLKAIHITCVVASGTGFFARGLLMLAGSPWLNARLVRVTPHIIDTLLLASAITMAVIAHLVPTQQPWLMAKIIGLIAYIVLGAIALRRGRTRTQRTLAFVAALATFAYIVGVALTRSPSLGL